MQRRVEGIKVRIEVDDPLAIAVRGVEELIERLHGQPIQDRAGKLNGIDFVRLPTTRYGSCCCREESDVSGA